ncbi:hypothetical protein [Natronocella acetinitrilica]|uniref:hypothetical protein n=1 Tax=Natronocella acetinitrilica TaxID=414046 RepID=UPI00209FAFAA|nr:hypothetical protein [Natronocella acetinitrilica]
MGSLDKRLFPLDVHTPDAAFRNLQEIAAFFPEKIARQFYLFVFIELNRHDEKVTELTESRSPWELGRVFDHSSTELSTETVENHD